MKVPPWRGGKTPALPTNKKMKEEEKKAIEYVDMICDQEPHEHDPWPFKTLEERTRENDIISQISAMVAEAAANNEVEPLLEIVDAHQKMLERITKILRMTDDEFGQKEGHLKNLDKRVLNLEGRSKPRKKYKTYMDEGRGG